MKIKKEQLDFLDWEIGVFFHFGIRTYYEGHTDWDMQPMDASAFNPSELNCDQWMQIIKKGGAKYAVLVCKHHDGFALWPSEYTNYSVASSRWKNGKGDVVKEFTDACRRHGIRTGLYYSPAQFGSANMVPEEYDDYFINQISELLSNYGKIDYLWFDGCGSENHRYDEKRIINVIRALQPHILIFNMWDPDTRWIGNEMGVAGLDDRITVNNLGFSVMTDEKTALNEKLFLPGECDLRIRETNWFYSDSDEHTVKSPEELFGLYLNSVGRSANFLLNIAPDRRGLLPEKDSENFIKFGQLVKKSFENPIYTAENPEEKNGMFCLISHNPLHPIDYIVIEEDISDGEHINSFEIRYFARRESKLFKTIYIGSFIGHKAIIPMNHICAPGLAIKVNGSDANYKLKRISLF